MKLTPEMGSLFLKNGDHHENALNIGQTPEQNVPPEIWIVSWEPGSTSFIGWVVCCFILASCIPKILLFWCQSVDAVLFSICLSQLQYLYSILNLFLKLLQFLFQTIDGHLCKQKHEITKGMVTLKTNHIPTTFTNHITTTYCTNHIPTTYQPCTNHIWTTYRPHTAWLTCSLLPNTFTVWCDYCTLILDFSKLGVVLIQGLA